MTKKLSLEFVKNQIERRGGILLSETYSGSNIKIEVKCEKGHIWYPTYSNISQGKWCSECAGVKKYTTTEVKNFILNKNGILLSKYTGNHKSIKVQCLSCNNIWYPTYANISQGKWCPDCAGVKKYTIPEVKKEIKKRNGILLYNKYRNANTKIKVKCNKCLTIWFPTFSRIQQGHWCPRCNSVKRNTQNKLSNIVRSIYSCEVIDGYKGFDWLRSKDIKRKQEIDIFIFSENFSLAIEYDGEQHFRPIELFGGAEGFKRRQYLDNNKNMLIKAHKNEVKYFIRFNYKDEINKKNVIEKLKKNNIPIT